MTKFREVTLFKYFMVKKIFIILFIFCLINNSAFASRPVRVALVLGSGGARGYAHVGVIKALQKAGIPIDLIVGSSSGSLIGGLYADSADSKLLEKIMLTTNFKSFVDISVLPNHGGLISGTQEKQFLAQHLKARDFKELKIKFIAVATDLQTGQAVILDKGLVISAIIASTALPGLVKPVLINGHMLIDGGVVEPIPVRIAKRYHPQFIIAINVNQPLIEKSPTGAVGIYTRAQEMIWRQFSKLSAQDADFTIEPQVGRVGTFALSQKQRLIKQGEIDTEQLIPQLKAMLNHKHIALDKPGRS